MRPPAPDPFEIHGPLSLRHGLPTGAAPRRAAPDEGFLPVPDQANDQRSIQRSPSRSQFEPICSGVATLSDVAKT